MPARAAVTGTPFPIKSEKPPAAQIDPIQLRDRPLTSFAAHEIDDLRAQPHRKHGKTERDREERGHEPDRRSNFHRSAEDRKGAMDSPPHRQRNSPG